MMFEVGGSNSILEMGGGISNTPREDECAREGRFCSVIPSEVFPTASREENGVRQQSHLLVLQTTLKHIARTKTANSDLWKRNRWKTEKNVENIKERTQ